jgi:cell division protease FtsH
MGGRAAEQIIFGHLSTGASNDLQQATRLAHDMVCNYGMSDKIGPVSYSDDGHDVFLGRDFVARKNYSEQTAKEIDAEVARIVTENYDLAKKLLENNRPLLDTIASALLERETIEARDIQMIMAGEELPPLPPPEVAEAKKTAPSRAAAEAKDFRSGEKLPDPEPVAS